MGSCSARNLFPQIKVSNGDLWVYPSLLMPEPSKHRGLERAERTLTNTYGRVPACSGKLFSCSKRSEHLLHPLTLSSLSDIGFAALEITLHWIPIFQGQLKQPFIYHFLTKFHFFFLHLLSLYLFRVLSLVFQFLLGRLLHK